MGVNKFIDTCAKYEVDVTPALAERAVSMYRKTFARVPAFWYAMEEAAKQTTLSGKPHTCGKIAWYMDGEFLRMRLPSGRSIVYHRPKITAEGKFTFLAVNSLTNKYEIEEAWGGKLVENATQAVARDIMVESRCSLSSALATGFCLPYTMNSYVNTRPGVWRKSCPSSGKFRRGGMVAR